MKQCKLSDCDSTDLATRSSLCREHHREYTRAHYQANKQAYLDKARKRNKEVAAKHREYLISYLKKNSCIDCGNSDIEVLQFDHREQSEKSGDVCTFLTGSTKRLIEEIKKCDIRCANCHMKRTRRQLGWWVSEGEI